MTIFYRCPWCDEPVDRTDPVVGDPTKITLPAWGQTVLLHPTCGAQLFNAGMQAKPKKPRRRSHPATAAGAAELVAYATNHPSTGRPRLTVVVGGES